MSTVTVLPHGRPLTYADLDDMPDDGHRYELVDGVLLVSPSPVTAHQRTVGELHLVLRAACPDDLEVLFAPFDVVLADDTVLIPDLLVTRSADLTVRNLPGPPLLAIEVLSPSTRRFDLLVKHARLEAAGCPAYWVVDPEEASLVAWELHDGRFVEVANVRGEESWAARHPFDVLLVPNRLVRA